jgi:RNA polymerase sigma-70 factor (ECF subfamily)
LFKKLRRLAANRMVDPRDHRVALLHDWGVMQDQLVNDIQAISKGGDCAAFTRLFEYFAPRVKAWMLRAGADMQTAEELAQETMLRVWRYAKKYCPQKAAPSTWVFAIARNVRIDRFRKEGRAVPKPTPESPTQRRTYEWDVLTTDGKNLRSWLTKLPPAQAQVLEMFYLEGKTQSVIAVELGVPIGTVKSRIQLALSRLRRLNRAGMTYPPPPRRVRRAACASHPG